MHQQAGQEFQGLEGQHPLSGDAVGATEFYVRYGATVVPGLDRCDDAGTHIA